MPKAVLKQIENVKTGVGIDIVGTMPLLDPGKLYCFGHHVQINYVRSILKIHKMI